MELVKCILFSKSLNKPINYNYMVNSELMPPEGLDADYEVYAYHIPFPKPEIDYRLFILNEIATVKADPHPLYPSVGTYEITYKSVQRDPEILKIDVKNAMTNANNSIYNGYNTTEITLKMGAIAEKRFKDEAIEPWMEEIVALNNEIAAKIQNNQDIYKQKIEAIENNLPFDLDKGWILE